MITFILLFFSFFNNRWMDPDFKTTPPRYILFSDKIHMLSESKMYLKGETNVADYTCDCNSSQLQLTVETSFSGSIATFDNAHMDVPTQQINCHNKLYNYNIKKGLESEKYNFIRIDLVKAWKTDGTPFINDSEWFDIESLTYVTIKEKMLQQKVKAKAMRMSLTKYHITGSHVLSMKDYDIKVPEIMFGLVKVKDTIVFHFDLYFEVIP